MIIACPHCHRQINAGGSTAGEVACPHCGGRLRIGRPEPPPVPASIVAPAAPTARPKAGIGPAGYTLVWLGVAWLASSCLSTVVSVAAVYGAAGINTNELAAGKLEQVMLVCGVANLACGAVLFGLLGLGAFLFGRSVRG